MDSQDEATCTYRRQKIREANDRLRRNGTGGRLLLTRAFAELPAETITRIIAAIRDFDAFTPANDPWQEHDFGQVTIDGENYFWKIDAYDINLEYNSPDPADDAVTRRVLTVMTAMDL